ncbi:MAG: hypothetical protein PV344_00640, partial [Anaplasma sp.]|nr:hypothetical protein [Anaplasma sp.]
PSDPPLRVVSVLVFNQYEKTTTPKSVRNRLLTLTQFCSGCNGKFRKRVCCVSPRPAHPMPSRKRGVATFNASKALIEGYEKKVDAPFETRGLSRCTLKSLEDRGSRGSPLGASSKGTEAIQF